MNRTDLLLSLRPEIPIDVAHSTPIESFMHQTLRPILKFQHPIVISVFQSYLLTSTIEFQTLSTEQKRDRLQSILKNDNKIKQLLSGLCVGLFTESEFAFFLTHEKEVKKRLTGMLIQRLESSMIE